MIRFAWAALLVLGGFSAVSAANYDYAKMWGTRAPVSCGPFTVDQIPVDRLNVVLATSIYQCGLEADAVGSESYLNLVEDIRLQLGKPREFGTSTTEYDFSDLDKDQPIYPVRVSQTGVRCHVISDILENKGKNCRETPQAGEGLCYVTAFGDWNCHVYVTATGPIVHDLPPRPH